jgi:hypothetical protein
VLAEFELLAAEAFRHALELDGAVHDAAKAAVSQVDAARADQDPFVDDASQQGFGDHHAGRGAAFGTACEFFEIVAVGDAHFQVGVDAVAVFDVPGGIRHA